MPKSLAQYLSEVRHAIPVREEAQREGSNATAPISEAVKLAMYRPPSVEEKAVSTAMLHASGPEEHAFLPQLEGMMAQRDCSCGCPSLSFAPSPGDTRVDLYRQRFAAEMTGAATDGLVGLFLWQAGGQTHGTRGIRPCWSRSTIRFTTA